MDMKKLLSIVDHSGVQQKAVITESVSAPTVSKTEQYFKAVNNEVLQNIKEQQAQKKIEVKRVVSRVLDKLEEGKTTKDKPAVRNFVAKNAPKADYQIHTTNSSESQQTMLSKLALTEDMIKELFAYSEGKNIGIFATGFENTSPLRCCCGEGRHDG
jgi:hypothetical protein